MSRSEDTNGLLETGTKLDGFYVQTNGEDFGDGTPRRTAALKRSLRTLETSGYIRCVNNGIYEITDEGYARAEREEAASASAEPKLGERATELLKAAVRGNATITHRKLIGSELLYAGGREFIQAGNARSVADWNEAVQELIDRKLVAARSESLYQVTAAGFRLQEELDKSAASARPG